MNNIRLTYLLTLNSPSQRALRLWTGKTIHTFRHCSAKQIGSALIEMQKNVDDLQKSLRTLQHMKEQLVSVSAERGGETRNNGSLKTATRFGGHDKRSCIQRKRNKKDRHGPDKSTWAVFSEH